MNMHDHRKNYRILKTGLIGLLAFIFLQCAGLVKLNIPQKAYENPEESWLTAFKNNQRQNATENDVLPPYEVLWDKRYRSVVTDQMLAVDNYLIFTTRNGMLAFIKSDGGEMMGDGRLAPGFSHSGTLSDNVLYYAANLGDKTLGAFNISKLDKIWENKLPNLNTSPLLLEKNLFVGAFNGDFFSFDKASGEKKWEFTAASSLFGVPASLNSRIYFTDIKGNVYCLNADKGKKIWTSRLAENLYAGPVVGDNKLFIGSTAGTISALDAATGKILWERETHGSIYGNAAYRDGAVYVGNNAHKLIALDAATGKILWEFSAKGIINTAPLAGPDFIYFGSWDKTFYVVERKSGKLLYSEEFNRPIKSSPIIYRDRIFFHTSNDHIYCLGNKQLVKKMDNKK